MNEAVPNRSAGLGAWMRLLRISNAPTALTGAMVGAMVGMHGQPGTVDARLLGLCAGGAVLLYAGGMVMNDYFDQPIDRVERPDRPIVSGQVSQVGALTLGMMLLAAGVAAFVTTGGAAVPWSLLLLAAILAYNLLHRDTVAGPLLMASCRMLVPILSAIACAAQHRPDWNLLAAVAMPLGAHTMTISLAARNEAVRGPGSRPPVPVPLLSMIVLVAALAPTLLMAAGALQPFPRESLWFAIPPLLAAVWVLWHGRAHLLRADGATRGVMAWIAAIAFVDAASIALLAGGALVFVATGAGVLTLALQRRILGS